MIEAERNCQRREEGEGREKDELVVGCDVSVEGDRVEGIDCELSDGRVPEEALESVT